MRARFRLHATAALLPLGLGLTGCDRPQAYGDANAIIIAAAPDVWPEVEETVLAAMEPTILTVRDERPFRITYQDPTVGEDWGNLRRFREVLVIGTVADPWVAEPLSLLDEDEIPAPPAILQVDNAWARGQTVTILLVPPGGVGAAVADLAPEVRDVLDQQFRTYAISRMFATGADTVLADSLLATAGFALTIPAVYRVEAREDLVRFRNDNPSPAELIREIWVTWTSPVPAEDPTRQELAEWRTNLVLAEYNDPQVIDTVMVSHFGPVEVNGREGVEFQAAWVNAPGGWPAGGPFITRAIPCPGQDRLYWMDAWLYAPGRDKYEYMIQLETILNSFRCR
jgi:hypothetical protein